MPHSSTELIARRSELGRGLVAARFADTAIAALGLKRMRTLMERLGGPQDRYPVIHIAGSKGKGTTAHIAAAVLTGQGYRTGRYTSPHLHAWNERIAIDDRAIPEADFARVLAQVDAEMSVLERDRPDLGACNAFELLTATSFMHFAEHGVEVAVVEVGLGGRFDSTSVVHAATSVITRIEREHAEILGPSLSEIAWNKAGIITSSVPVVVSRQEPAVMAVIEAEAAATDAPLTLEGRDWSAEPSRGGVRVRVGDLEFDHLHAVLPGSHNSSNLGAAVAAVTSAIPDLKLDPSALGRSLAGLRIPGRFERLTVGSPPVAWVLDVAHTRESIVALLSTVAQEVASGSPIVAMALLADKPAEEILEAIAGRIDLLILPEVSHPRAVPARDLAALADRLGIPVRVVPDLTAAIDTAGASGQPVVVTGSFTIVGQVGVALGLESDSRP